MTEAPAIAANTSTKTRILDAAEKLFGMNGFDATSLRDITTEAGVNLAAVNYHFQSKESLIDAVIERRIEPVNRLRIELLEAAGPNPTVEQILTAFLAPVLAHDIRPMVPLMGRMLSNPGQFLDRVFKKHLTSIARRFQDAMAAALPEMPFAEVLWRYHFLAGMMTHVMCWSEVLPVMTGGLCSIEDRKALVDRLVSFAAAGFRGYQRN